MNESVVYFVYRNPLKAGVRMGESPLLSRGATALCSAIRGSFGRSARVGERLQSRKEFACYGWSRQNTDHHPSM